MILLQCFALGVNPLSSSASGDGVGVLGHHGIQACLPSLRSNYSPSYSHLEASSNSRSGKNKNRLKEPARRTWSLVSPIFPCIQVNCHYWRLLAYTEGQTPEPAASSCCGAGSVAGPRSGTDGAIMFSGWKSSRGKLHNY